MASSPLQSDNRQVDILHWQPGGRKFLVCIRAGRKSAHAFWFEGAEPRDWDLMIHYYDVPSGGPDLRGEFVATGGLSKFSGIKELWRQKPELLEMYDAVMFLDGDIVCKHSDISVAFSVFTANGLDLAQPSLSHESAGYWDLTYSSRLHEVRYTNFVEIMMPMFSRRALSLCLRTFDASVSGYGLDFVWPRLLGSSERSIGVIDCVAFTHPTPVDLVHGAFYKYLRTMGIDPTAELQEVVRRYGVTDTTVTQLGGVLDLRAVQDSNQQIAELIAAADLPEHARLTVVTRIGPQRVIEILVDELVYRADLGPSTVEFAVEFRFRLDGVEFAHTVFLGPSGVRHRRARRGVESHAIVTQDLGEALQAVFGARGAISSATRVLHWCERDDPDATSRLAALFPQVERLLAGMDASADQVSLSRLAVRYGSDKWGIHQYTPHYERYFEPLRDRPLTVLELGIGGYSDSGSGGASLRMWKRYFRRAAVFGVDITDKSHCAEQRVTPLLGDQSSPDSLERIAEQTGPLDIVIDDGSHVPAHIITSFHSLFPKLRPGGLYVIEDLQTSYWPYWGGKADKFDDPTTSVGFFKSLVDGLNHEEMHEAGGRVPLDTDAQIRSLHFHHNLVVIEKGSNTEGGAPAWIQKV